MLPYSSSLFSNPRSRRSLKGQPQGYLHGWAAFALTWALVVLLPFLKRASLCLADMSAFKTRDLKSLFFRKPFQI